MSKFQVPTVGGIRKVIRTTDNTSAVLTTISEAIAQLAALVVQLQNPANTGGGNIGTGNEASIQLGPGLSGGGVLVGNVPINLTIPSALIAEDGIDGDPGMQGIQGPQGKQGIPGQPWFTEDGADGDNGIQGIRGIQGAIGVAGIPGVFFDDYPSEELLPQVASNATGDFTINGHLFVNHDANTAGDRTILLKAITTDARLGISTISSGNAQINLTTVGVQDWVISNFRTDGSLRFSASQTPGSNDELIIATNGVATFSNSVGIKGSIPVVTAGQTDLGITTTNTVITTAGGVAIPALAATMWRVNVNGTAYGVPLFAL